MRKMVGVQPPGMTVLDAFAVNEVQMIFLFVKWSGCTDVGYSLAGLKIEPKGAFARPTDKQIQTALKDMMV